eukprot:2086610-Alexandrium_andersonii.AAC.1
MGTRRLTHDRRPGRACHTQRGQRVGTQLKGVTDWGARMATAALHKGQRMSGPCAACEPSGTGRAVSTLQNLTAVLTSQPPNSMQPHP